MDLNSNTMTENDELKCKICMDHFNDPVINPDSPNEIYCEKCLILWNGSNTKSPTNGPMITNWIKVPYFTKLCLITRIRTNLNLIKLIDFDSKTFDFHSMGLNDATHILDVIDIENFQRIESKDFKNVIVFKEIFKHTRLIQKIVELLIEFEIEWRGTDGWAISHYISRFGNIDLIQWMIEHNKNNEKFVHMDAINDKGYSVIGNIFGVNNVLDSMDQLLAMELIINHCVNSAELPLININATEVDGWSPILLVSSYNNHLNSSDQLKALKKLIQHNVNLDVMSKKGWTPLNFVCSDMNNFNSSDQCEAIKFIISTNPTVDLCVKSSDRQWSPFILVSSTVNHLDSKDQLEIIKIFIDNKSIDLNIKDSNQWTAMHYICGGFNNMRSDDLIQCIELLMKEGPRVCWDSMDNIGMKPIDLVFRAKLSDSEKLKIIEILLRR
jgi:ankyrin repeat protein